MENTVKEPETAPVAAAPKKRGWPKGKPRKPLGVTVEQAVAQATEKLAAPRKRRRRRSVPGVFVGKEFYPGYAARWEDSGNFLKVVADGTEVWIPIDRTKPIKVKGFSLPPLVRYGSGSTWITANSTDSTGGTSYPQHIYTSATLQAHGSQTGPRVVNPADYVNVEPDREAYLRRQTATRNSELDNLMRPPAGIPED